MSDDNRFQNRIRAVSLIESLLKIKAKLNDTTLPLEKRRLYINQELSLLKQGSIELRKPVNPKLLTKEERKYLREPLASYFHELGREMKKQFNSGKPKKPKRSKKKKKSSPQIIELPPETDEEIARLFHLYTRDPARGFERMQYLDQLEIEDKEENNERNMRCEIELFSFYLISRYISLRLELINVSEEEKQNHLQQELVKKENLVEQYERLKFVLDQIIKISLTLNSKSLNEEEKANLTQKRNEFRAVLKMEFVEQVKSGIRIEEDFKDFQIKQDKLLEVMDQNII